MNTGPLNTELESLTQRLQELSQMRKSIESEEESIKTTLLAKMTSENIKSFAGSLITVTLAKRNTLSVKDQENAANTLLKRGLFDFVTEVPEVPKHYEVDTKKLKEAAELDLVDLSTLTEVIEMKSTEYLTTKETK